MQPLSSANLDIVKVAFGGSNLFGIASSDHQPGGTPLWRNLRVDNFDLDQESDQLGRHLLSESHSMGIVFGHFKSFERQTQILVNVRMYQLPDYDQGREQAVAARQRTPEPSDVRPILLQILMRVAAMPSFFKDVNLRQFAHHRMTFGILRDALVEVSGDVFRRERAKHHRNPRGQVL